MPCHLLFPSRYKCNTDLILLFFALSPTLPPFLFSIYISIFLCLQLCKLTVSIANFLDRIARSRNAGSHPSAAYAAPFLAHLVRVLPCYSSVKRQCFLLALATRVQVTYITRWRDCNRDFLSYFASVRLLTFILSCSLPYPTHTFTGSLSCLFLSAGFSQSHGSPPFLSCLLIPLRAFDLSIRVASLFLMYIHLEISLARRNMQFRTVRIQSHRYVIVSAYRRRNQQQIPFVTYPSRAYFIPCLRENFTNAYIHYRTICIVPMRFVNR